MIERTYFKHRSVLRELAPRAQSVYGLGTRPAAATVPS